MSKKSPGLREKIEQGVDIALLYSEMIEENWMDPEAVTNSYLKTEDGALSIGYTVDVAGEIKESERIICPFHDTKDLDASLNRKGGFFKCFSTKCKTKGVPLNIFDFMIALCYNVHPLLVKGDQGTEKFGMVLKKLSHYLGISYAQNENYLTEEQIKERMIKKIRTEAAAYYHYLFKHTSYGKKAKEYILKTRGFQHSVVPFEELCDRFKIGVAPGRYGDTRLYDHLKKKYSDEQLLEAGVCKIIDEFKYENRKKVLTGKKIIVDRLTNRLTFGYTNRTRKLSESIYGRSLYPEIEKQHRHRRLEGGLSRPFHYDVACEYEEILVVEGEISCASLVAMGFENVIGTKGTEGLTDLHITMLADRYEKTKYSDEVKCRTLVLCFDPDQAGIDAVVKLGNRLIQAGLDVRVARLSQYVEVDKETGKEEKKGDTNDLLVTYEKKAGAVMQRYIDQAISFEGFIMLYSMKKWKPKTRTDCVGVMRAVQNQIGSIPKDMLYFMAYEIAELLKVEGETLHQLWGVMDHKQEIKQEIKEVERELEKALQEQWIFAVDSPALYQQLKQSECASKVVNIEKMNLALFAKKIKENAHGVNVVLHSGMVKERKDQLLQLLKERPLNMVMEGELFKEKGENTNLTMKEITRAMKIME